MPGPVPRMEIPGWGERYGVLAGITTRGPGADGDTPGEFDLGLWTDSPVREVMGRWRALRRAAPGFHAVVLGHQVHGARVAWHTGGEGWIQVEGIDGHATAAPGILLTVTVADCIPVYLVDPVAGAVALLHSGWRGTAGGILSAGVKTLVEGCGSNPANIAMHCGVGVCGSCYEVGSEVMSGCGLPADGEGPWHLDLRSVLARQAGDLGLGELSTSQFCTVHDRHQFFSHRASGGRDGRMVAYLGRRPPP